MLSWTTIRNCCAILLMVPVIHLCYLLSQDVLRTLDTAPATWLPEIEQLTEVDNAQLLPREPVLVLGGKRVTLWRGLDEILAPIPVLMRGIGDATVTDLIHFRERLISYYRPSAVVLLTSNSEFHLRDNKSGTELSNSIMKLVDLAMEDNEGAHFYVFTPLRTPRHPSDDKHVSTATRKLLDWADNSPLITVIDANPLLQTQAGEVNPAYYRSDGVNLNERGYLRLSLLLLNTFEAQALQDAAHAPIIDSHY